jgi:GDP-mannose 6-dehydrogenase
MKIAVYGLGYVGLTAAVCLAREGHDVVGVDVSEDKVRLTRAGVSTIREPGMDALLAEALVKRALRCTTDASEPIEDCEIAIVCVGTPTGLDGAHNMSFITEVSRQIARAIDAKRRAPLTVVYRSTVRPGTVENLILPIFRAALGPGGRAYEIVYNPEFLREASAIEDFFDPPKIVVGTADGLPNARMDEMNRNLRAPVFYTKYRESEITKFADNGFHALKVAYANELGRICQQLDLDISDVYRIFVSDTKLNISAYYLKPGGPFGGSCLPKDVRALQHIAAELGANTHVIDSVLRSNEAHKHYLFQRSVRGLQPGAQVLLVGLAFKSHSDDLRESPNIYLARRLIESGYGLSAYDPNLRPELLRGQNLGQAYTHLPSIAELLVTRETAETTRYDLVIDANGMARELALIPTRVIEIGSMH